MLTLQDLRQDSRDRKDVDRETCRIVLANCHELVKTTNLSGQTRVVFHVPGMVEGRPIMPCRQIALYVQHRLIKGGINASIMSDNHIYIDWSQDHTTASQAPRPNDNKLKSKQPATKKASSDAAESRKLRKRLLDFRRRAEGWVKA